MQYDNMKLLAIISEQLCWKNAALLGHFDPTHAHTKITTLLFSVPTLPQLLSLSFQQDSSRVQGEWRVTGAGGSSMSGPCISIRLTALMFLWKWLTLSLLQSWVSVGAWAADPVGAGFSSSTGPLGWLLSDKGPFHHSQEFVDFTERYQQGFTTKYKIYRWEKVDSRIRGGSLHGLQNWDAWEEGCLWNLKQKWTKCRDVAHLKPNLDSDSCGFACRNEDLEKSICEWSHNTFL